MVASISNATTDALLMKQHRRHLIFEQHKCHLADL